MKSEITSHPNRLAVRQLVHRIGLLDLLLCRRVERHVAELLLHLPHHLIGSKIKTRAPITHARVTYYTVGHSFLSSSQDGSATYHLSNLATLLNTMESTLLTLQFALKGQEVQYVSYRRVNMVPCWSSAGIVKVPVGVGTSNIHPLED